MHKPVGSAVALPSVIEPMKATSAPRLPPEDGQWAYELKWDGVRAVAFIQAGRLRLQSRSLREITGQYPELISMVEGVVEPMVLDGEVVAFDAAGRPSFERLQARINLTTPADVAHRMAGVPVVYMAFDVLRIGSSSLMGLPYVERRARLEDLSLGGSRVQVPAYHLGDGAALLEGTRAQGLEGLVAKRVDSTYLPGRRSRSWLKIKNVRRQEMVVGGWLPGEGHRAGHLGALLVGHYDQGRLAYAGRVGSGFSHPELQRLAARLAVLARATTPFSDESRLPGPVKRLVRWVEPRLVVEVAFAEWTSSGTLRAPSYKGEHHDRDARHVRRES